MNTLAFHILFGSSNGLRVSQDATGFRLGLGTPTTFFATLPPFLVTNQGFYLGQTIQLQISINGQLHYLEFLGSNSYSLTFDQGPTNLQLQFLSLNLLWSQPIQFNPNISTVSSQSMNVQLMNFSPQLLNLPSQITFQKRNPSPNILVYPLSACSLNNNVAICGVEVCPEDFVVSQGSCVNPSQIQNQLAFGIRYLDSSGNTIVVTYELEPNGDIIFRYIPLTQLFADPNPFGLEERWFFIDSIDSIGSGNTSNPTLSPNTDYPIYVTFNTGSRFYLTLPPSGLITTSMGSTNLQSIGETRYSTVDESSGEVLSFRTPQDGNFNQFIFSETDFLIGNGLGVDFPNLSMTSPTIALWKGV